MPRQPITINSRLVEEMSSIIALLLLGGTIAFASFAQRPVLASSPPPCTYKYKQGFRPFPLLQIKNETNYVPGSTEKAFIVPVYISKTGGA